MTKEQYEIAKEIITQVNKYFETDCRIKSRKINIVRPRMYACKIIRELTSMRLQDIADLFGQNYDTVIHSIKVVDSDLQLNSKYREYYLDIRSVMKSSDVYKNSELIKSSKRTELVQDINNILMGKSLTKLQQILKTIR
jgi:hypothetical protein